MESKQPRRRTVSRRSALRLALNIGLALFMVVSLAGLQSPAHAAPGGQRRANDPFDLWPEEVFDFAPPSPEIQEFVQPDSSTFQARLTPMEVGGHFETTDGYTVLKNDKGWWTYAEEGDGVTNPAGKLVPSSLKVGKDVPEGIAKKLGRTPSLWLDEQGNDKRAPLFDALHDTSSPNDSVFTAADVEPKIYRYVVILVQYQDVKFADYQTPEWFQERISGLGTSPTGSVTDLYYENSYGQFMPLLDVYGPITSDYNMAQFDYQIGGWSVSRAISNELGDKVKDLVPWDEYDNDRVVYTRSGEQYRSVDMVVVLHAGPGKEATGIDGQIWSHASSANFRTGVYGEDGLELRIRAANTCPAEGFNIGVTSHEMGHSIGERDYYATSYNSMGAGDWDLMAGGSWMGDDPAGSNPTHMNPYSKINQGWIEPTVITESTPGVELRPRSLYPDIIQIPLGGEGGGSTGAEECIFVEHISNRAPGAVFDKAAAGSGLIIWHYDQGGSQNNPARYNLAVEEYDLHDGTQELRLNLNRGEPTDPWSDTALGMTPYTSPNTDRNTPLDGTTATGWYLENISAIGPTMTLDIVQGEDAAPLALDFPGFAAQPVLTGTGPADIAVNVYNQTADPLSDVTVEFVATIGEAEVQLAETTLATLDPGAPANVTAAWAEPLPGKFAVAARATVGDVTVASAGTLRVFSRPAPVLIVDDDDGFGAEQAYEGVLSVLGVPYVLVEHTADLATLQQYDLVIWEAGQAGRMEGQLNLQEAADLKAYLNAGGKLWMTSPRLAAALAATGAAAGIDPAMLHDYFGANYPMSSQAGGGTITGLGHPIGGTGSYELRSFPGRAIQDFLQPAESALGTVSPLFTWSYGDYMGMEVIGGEAYNNFHVVYFGFNLCQVISGADRLLLTQQVLDRLGIATIYFDDATYLMQQSGAVRVFLRQPGAVSPTALVTSDAQPEGVSVALHEIEIPGTYMGTVNLQKNPEAKGNALKVNDVDTLHVAYEDAPGHTIWAEAAVLTRVAQDLPPNIYHDLIFSTTDAQDLPVLAVVTDDIQAKRVDLFYRLGGGEAYTRLHLEAVQRGAYMGTIPAAAVTPLGVEYYVTASDSEGNISMCASAENPQFIAVQPRTLGQ